MYGRIVIGCCAILIALAGVAPGGPHPMHLVIPPGFPQNVTVFDNNPLTEEGFALGRKLFYDGRLSRDGNFPCASCHQPFAAFSTYDHTFSHGFDNSFTTRNAPGLFNLAWETSFHWDGGVNHLEVQPLSPLTAPNEMAEDLGNVLRKLGADTAYHRMFKAAFGSDSINSQRMLKALAQFTGSLISAGSKYDLYKQGKATFNEIEVSGYNIYKTKCASCHPEPLFTDGSFRNNGLTINSLGDRGRMRITGDRNDSLKFKVPSPTQPFADLSVYARWTLCQPPAGIGPLLGRHCQKRHPGSPAKRRYPPFRSAKGRPAGISFRSHRLCVYQRPPIRAAIVIILRFGCIFSNKI